MNKPKHSYEEIESAEFDLEHMKKEYLWSRGWEQNGKYPGGLALWHHAEKGYKGCNLKTAYNLQSNQETEDSFQNMTEEEFLSYE